MRKDELITIQDLDSFKNDVLQELHYIKNIIEHYYKLKWRSRFDQLITNSKRTLEDLKTCT